MSYFIAINTLSGWKALNRNLHPTPPPLPSHSSAELKVFDADHEPGQSILRARHGFS